MTTSSSSSTLTQQQTHILVYGEANIKDIENNILNNKKKQYVGDMIFNDPTTKGSKGAEVKYQKYKGIILSLFIYCIRNNSKLTFSS